MSSEEDTKVVPEPDANASGDADTKDAPASGTDKVAASPTDGT